MQRSIRNSPRARAPLIAAALAAASAAVTAPVAAEPLPKVASINLCADQHVLGAGRPGADSHRELARRRPRGVAARGGSAAPHIELRHGRGALEVRTRRRAGRHVHEPFHAHHAAALGLPRRRARARSFGRGHRAQRAARRRARRASRARRAARHGATRGRARNRSEPARAKIGHRHRSARRLHGRRGLARQRAAHACRPLQRRRRARARPLGQLVDGGVAAQLPRAHRADGLSQHAAFARERRARASGARSDSERRSAALPCPRRSGRADCRAA